MEILRLRHAQFSHAYGILCFSLPKKVDRDGLYPTFCRIPPGGKTTAHSHFEPELFYIVSGNGLMIIKDEAEKVDAGDLIRIPSLSKHELKNRCVDDLVFLSVYSEDFETMSLPASTVVTAAPPTPNGPLHLGHISGPYLASDIVVRYLRMRSVDVRNHSGTDDHQNYIFEKAHFLQMKSDVFRLHMRKRIQKGLQAMQIEFDEFIEPKTDEVYQKRILGFVQRAIKSEVIKLEAVELPHCKQCNRTLVDSLIVGNCPCCKAPSQGICENCGMVVPPQDLLNATCSLCKILAQRKLVSVYTFSLSRYFPAIQKELSELPLSSRLRDLIERVGKMHDLKILLTHPDASDQGLSLPGSNQVLHVWFEMAAHYEQFALGHESWTHCFGFDNSFHYLLFIPSLLRAMNPQAKLPDAVITNEFLLLDGLKFSTSREHAIWADEFAGNTDHLRLYLSFYRPSSRVADFSLENFQHFSASLNAQLQQLNQRARIVAQLKQGDIFPQKLIDCNRFTRDMERSLAPKHFNSRRASRQLVSFMDDTIQSVGSGRGERLMLQVFGTLMAPFMPNESENLLNALEESSRSWRQDWTNA